jgi:hypothetical protein
MSTTAVVLSAGFVTHSSRGDVFTNVPSTETNGFQLVYDLNIPNAATFNNSTVPYTTDNHASITQAWDRVAYYMELQDASNNTTWAYASMDSFGAGLRKIGIPALPSGVTTPTVFQTNVNNLHVFSNSASVTTGTSFAAGAGNIEFWPNNYTQANSPAVAGASGTAYDFGDQVTTPANGYGSFQIHNHATGTTPAGQTIIAYNHWGNGGATASDVGIGTNTTVVGSNSQINPDYTFSQNAGSYVVKRLEVLVHTATTATFTDASTVTPLANGYKLVYGVQLPRAGGFQGNVSGGGTGTTFNNGVPYQVDRTEAVNGPIARIGYYMELHKKTDPAGQNQWVFVSMDAFTQNLKQIAVPSTDTGAFFQQNVTNLAVASNVSGVITGSSLGNGNIEFWPSNYAATKAAASPSNASDSTFDFGDSGGSTGTGYGSFQIHNPGASQTILAYNNWGTGGGDADLGIGNATTGTNPDWTFLHNAFNDYDIRNLQVYVQEVPEPSSLGMIGAAGLLLLRRRRNK